MQNFSSKDSEHSSVHSTSNFGVTCPWWNSSGSHILQFSLSKNLSLNMGSPTQNCHQMKQLGPQLQDQDSSSTQSTGQSHQEVEGMREGNPHEQCFSARYDKNDSDGKQAEENMKSTLSLGTPEGIFPAQKVDYNQSVACIPYPYVDSYYAGAMAVYGPHAIIHPQMLGVASSARVPLPIDLSVDEPIYVNPKQYRGIMRRRELRAKLEAQNKLAKGRKPYLHESRHLHAMKRVRGSSGRFVNTKKQEQQQQQQNQQSNSSTPTTDGHKVSGFDLLQLNGGGCLSESEVLQSENGIMGACGSTSCSEVTSISNNSGILHLPDTLRFSSSDFRFHHGGSMQGGGDMMHNRSQQRGFR